MEDIEHVMRIVGKKPEKIVLYTSPSWKYEAMEIIGNSDMKNIGALIKEIIDMAPPEYRKMVPKFVQNMVKRIRSEGRPEKMDEKEILMDSVEFLKGEYGCEVIVESANNPSYDPAGKSKVAEPMRPAIYVE
jgi:leucyl-tRNA synthetase